MSADHLRADKVPRRIRQWLLYPSVFVLVMLVGIIVDPGFLCCAPFAALLLMALSNAVRAHGVKRVVAIAWTLLFGIGLFNYANLALTTRPIRVLGGRVCTSGDGMSDILGPAAVSFVDLRSANIGDADLAKLRSTLDRFPRLRTLDMSGSQITDRGLDVIRGLKQLTILDLKKTRITDHGLEVVHALPALRSVTLHETQVTDAGVSKLQQARPDLNIQR